MTIRNVVLFIVIFLCIQGCGLTKTHWQTTLWQYKESPEKHNKNKGTLQDENFVYDIIVTDFGRVTTTVYSGGSPPEISRSPKTLMTVAIRCRNKSNDTAILNSDPIQMIDTSKTLAKKLTHDEVVFKLYGGKMKESLKFKRLEELEKPIHTNSTLFGDLLAVIAATQREQEKTSLINEMFEKEHALYQTFHESFEPVSLPSGVAADWVQYYHYTQGDIHILLQGQNVSDACIFTPPPPTQLNSEPTTTNNLQTIDATTIIVGAAIVIAGVILGYRFFYEF